MTQTATKCLGVTRTAKNSDAENYYPMMPGPSFYHEGAKYEDYNDFANPMKVALEAWRKNKSGRWIFVCDGEKALYKG